MNATSSKNNKSILSAGSAVAASPTVAKAPSGVLPPAPSLADKMPLAYQRGVQDFYGRDFVVSPDVLIPRPETEQIIDLVLTLAGKPYLPGVKAPVRVLPKHPVILDVGTGSGCIAITLSLELPEAKVYATDISSKAIKIAQKNATKHSAPTSFIISHLIDEVKEGTLPTPDIIVANLPYVDPNWDWLDKTALSHEPSLALYASNHGLALIKELILESNKLKIPRLILEADPCQHDEIISIAQKTGFKLVEARGFILYFSS